MKCSAVQGRRTTESQATRRAKAALRKALPENEWRAVEAWVSTFLPYQREWVLDLGRYSVLLKARQIGASHGYGGAAALWGLLGESTTLVSVGEREAAELLEKVGKHAEVLHRLGSKWAKPIITATTIRFPESGGEVKAVPSTSAGRGRTGNVVLDECAYYERPEKVWDGAAGSALRQGKIRLASTPNGIGNLFHTMWSDPAASVGYRKFATTIDDAIADGLNVDIAECWKLARGDARVFDQLFRCKFLDNDAQYISSDLIGASMIDRPVQGQSVVYAGLDVGKSADLTALVLLKLDAKKNAFVTKVETARRTSQADLDRLAATAFAAGARRLCIDATGMGSFPAEAIQKRYGVSKVEMVNFTLKSKEDMATTMGQFFSDGRIYIPRSETKLRDDITMIRRIVTSAGNVRYDAAHTDQGHADTAWALALALHGASFPSPARGELDESLLAF